MASTQTPQRQPWSEGERQVIGLYAEQNPKFTWWHIKRWFESENDWTVRKRALSFLNFNACITMFSTGSLISWVILHPKPPPLDPSVSTLLNYFHKYLVPIVSFRNFLQPALPSFHIYQFSLNIRIYWLQSYSTWLRRYACNKVPLYRAKVRKGYISLTST